MRTYEELKNECYFRKKGIDAVLEKLYVNEEIITVLYGCYFLTDANRMISVDEHVGGNSLLKNYTYNISICDLNFVDPKKISLNYYKEGLIFKTKYAVISYSSRLTVNNNNDFQSIENASVSIKCSSDMAEQYYNVLLSHIKKYKAKSKVKSESKSSSSASSNIAELRQMLEDGLIDKEDFKELVKAAKN